MLEGEQLPPAYMLDAETLEVPITPSLVATTALRYAMELLVSSIIANDPAWLGAIV